MRLVIHRAMRVVFVDSKFPVAWQRVAEAFPRGRTAGAIEELSQPEK